MFPPYDFITQSEKAETKREKHSFKKLIFLFRSVKLKLSVRMIRTNAARRQKRPFFCNLHFFPKQT